MSSTAASAPVPPIPDSTTPMTTIPSSVPIISAPVMSSSDSPSSPSRSSKPAAEPSPNSPTQATQPPSEPTNEFSHPLAPALASDTPTNPDAAPAATEAATPPGPLCHVRALVISGESHVFSFEPELTVGRMKELVWSMWPPQWTEPAQPPSPSFLRVLHAGRILSDESTLASNNIPAAVAPTIPTVIHISVRSFSLRPEDDAQKHLHTTNSRGGRNGRGDDVGGCKCVIM